MYLVWFQPNLFSYPVISPSMPPFLLQRYNELIGTRQTTVVTAIRFNRLPRVLLFLWLFFFVSFKLWIYLSLGELSLKSGSLPTEWKRWWWWFWCWDEVKLFSLLVLSSWGTEEVVMVGFVLFWIRINSVMLNPLLKYHW